jgi:hypothetical protein
MLNYNLGVHLYQLVPNGHFWGTLYKDHLYKAIIQAINILI